MCDVYLYQCFPCTTRLEEMAERLSEEATSFKPELTTPFKPLLQLIHHVPLYN